MKKSFNSNGSNMNDRLVKNGSSDGLLPYSIKFITSCVKKVSSNVRSAAASISSVDHHHKDQVLWACFDRLELGPTTVKQALLIGYSNGFQVLDVEDASNISELISRRDDDPVTFLQMQPTPAESEGCEGFRKSHPMLLVVATDALAHLGSTRNGKDDLFRDGFTKSHLVNLVNTPTTVRFYSLRSRNYVHILRFRSTVYMIRCSQQIVAVGLEAQIYCFDALTLENKFSVLTHPIPQVGVLGITAANNGYGPMALGPRWLAYASNNPLHLSTGRLSPQSLSPSLGVSPSTSPSDGNLVARYAVESTKHLAAGLINLGDMGYKTLLKFCHEFRPDGSGSPVSSNLSWKVGRHPPHSTDMDAAGMVVIKDFKSRDIIAQFRAHTSPISALCFDPSGTLLLTASIHGNNINIFRIMPSSLQNGFGTNWNASRVHLYKLRRGMTSAVIQDICFSHSSQWVSIVSSRGTCHVYLLSPFGGETGLHLVNSHADRSTHLPVLSMPWWSSSRFMTNQQSSPPPPPPQTITLSVVSRIKNGGWLNSMSNAASSVAGNVLVPSGVVAAVFPSALCQTTSSTLLDGNVLEHLLVYSPSGHLIRYELLPWLGVEQWESFSRNGPGSSMQMQEEESRVKVKPVRWWDVCRRADWPDREEPINEITIGRFEASELVTRISSCDDNASDKDLVKPLDRSHWYLSNAEVQLKSGRIPIWQSSKIGFYMMGTCVNENQNGSINQMSGEVEIEKIPVRAIQIRRKGFLPIFDHFQGINPAYGGLPTKRNHANVDEREQVNGRYTPPITSSSSKGKSNYSMASETKLLSVGVSEKPNPDSLRTSRSLYNFNEGGVSTLTSHVGLSVDQNDNISYSNVLSSAPLNQQAFDKIGALHESSVEEIYVVNSQISPRSAFYLAAPGETPIQVSQVCDDDITLSSTTMISGVNKIVKEGRMYEDVHQPLDFDHYFQEDSCEEGRMHEDVHQPLDFDHYFQEDSCEDSTNNESQELASTLADIGNNQSLLDKEKDDKYQGSDDSFGGVFALYGEGG